MATIPKIGDRGGFQAASQIRFRSSFSIRLFFNLSVFREISQLSANERFLTQKYQESEKGFEIIVKSMTVSVSVDIAHLDKTIDNLMNMLHP
jgi:hypothetical protein